MRPRYLEIQGLQSFKEKQSVDFDRLGETGLFGIFGPTGSGKSTVLDAVTLALYGNVQRALRGTQGIINTDSDSVKVSFAFDLLKYNKRKSYRVERVYKRKKDSEISAEAKIARLFEAADGEERILADKPSEVTQKVEDLIGLKLDDFTRSVVLPQNKFQEFLMMEKAKKREMLERIFYLEEYGRQLIDKVSKKLAVLRNSLSHIEGEMSGLGDASEKSLVEAESSMKAAKSSKEKLDIRLKLIEQRYNEAKEVWELVNELKYVCEQEQEHLKLSDEVDLKRKLYDASVRADGIINLVEKYRNTVKNLQETNNGLEAVNLQLMQLSEQLSGVKRAYEKASRELEEERPKLIEKKTRLNEALVVKREYEEVEATLTKLRGEYLKLKEAIRQKDNEIRRKREKIGEAEKLEESSSLSIDKLKVDVDYRNEIMTGVRVEEDIIGCENEIEKLSLQYKQTNVKVREIDSRLSELTKQKCEAESSVEQLKKILLDYEKSKPADRKDILQNIGAYHALKAAFDTLKLKKSGIDAAYVRKEDMALTLEQYKYKYNEFVLQKNELGDKLNIMKQQASMLKKQYEANVAYILAKGLNDNEPCPVCGSLHHPRPAMVQDDSRFKHLEQRLSEQQKLQDEAEQEYRASEDNLIKVEQQINGIESQISQLEEEIHLKEKEYEVCLMTFPESMRQMKFEEMEKRLREMLAKNDIKQKAADKWEKDIEKVRGDLTAAMEQLSGYIAEESGFKSESKVVTESLKQSGKAIEELNQKYSEKLKLYNVYIERTKIKDFKAEIKRLEENERQVTRLLKQKEQQQLVLKVLRTEYEKLAEDRRAISEKFAEIDSDGRNLRLQLDDKLKKMGELSGNVDIDAGLKFVEESMNNLILHQKRASEQLKNLEESFNNADSVRKTLENQRDIYEKGVKEEKDRLEYALKEKGFCTVEEVEKAILSKEEQQALNRYVMEYEKVLTNMEAHKNMLQKKLGERSITEEEWTKTSEEYQTVCAKKEVCIAEFEAAKNSYMTIKSKFERWMELNKKLQDKRHRCEMLEHIQKLLKGNSFVEFVSEERLRYVAREASETLGVLTKYRYAIEIDAENGFVIRDNANGGVLRLVSSLSGGETFLTSLSLALALSKQIQLKGQSPLEFFFLDEGFGTLDSNLLDTVIDSLGRLSSKNRVIGLITHVPELKNRITRRLIVEPPAIDGKGSRVRIERG